MGGKRSFALSVKETVMAEAGPPDDLDRRVQIMTTTHFTLATQRSSTIAEANGRSSLFLTSVSMSLVALGFIAQATKLGAAFYVFAYVLLACLILIGLVTFDRVVQTGVEDGMLARGEARVRRFYAEATPGIERWFVLPMEDGPNSRMATVAGGSPLQVLLTTGSMVGVVDAALTGALAGLLASREGGLGLSAASWTGLGVSAATGALLLASQVRRWRRAERGA